MHEPGSVDCLQPLGQPGRQREHRIRGQWPVLVDHVGQRRAIDVRGSHPGQVSVGVGIDDGRREHAANAARGGHLPGESLAEPSLGRQLWPDHLDGDGSPARRPSQVYLAHPACSQQP